jgi:glycerophosphoryl diester phosphodiesterase
MDARIRVPLDEQKRGVKDLTWSEVSRLDIGSWKDPKFARQRVPRMDAIYRILRKHPRRRLYIDIKNVDLVQLAKEAKAARVTAQLILASTDYSVICRWKELAPDSASLHWMGGGEDVLSRRIADLRKTGFAGITQLQIHIRVTDGVMAPSAEFLLSTGAELRAHGVLFQTLPWQSNDPELFRHLMDLGSASFATDYPDVAMKTIREYYQRRRERK